ncbi:PASTA domain-containing protein [Isoptericola sp. NPDC019693]|uniref:PASTA domain-containing protein n=1 Tax=Isoptericola sp. NPDC019693 TaxID=3364009 RepID=UPI0037B60802
MRSPKDTVRGVRVGRMLATATASCVLAAGFVAAPVAGLPWNGDRLQTLAADQHTPDVGAGSPVGEGVSVGVVGASASTGPTTLPEVLGVLERAELAGQDAGRRVTPAVEQAAAELGMLLSTYLAQQAATSSDRPFAAADAEVPAPVLPAPGPEVTEPEVTEPEVTGPEEIVPEETGPEVTTPDLVPPATVDGPEAVPVARQIALDPDDEPAPAAPAEQPGTQQPDAEQPDAEQPDAAQPDTEHPDTEQPAVEDAHADDEVTFDDLVVAATRLATLLDPATTTLEAGILPAGADGTVAARATLTASLREVVDRYGRSTAGFANGRIPASALCPLDFAPGHLLRCDAAEQLSALSRAYEKEFGVPIPMTDSYRSLELQIRVKATKGWLAATPGTSNHGWGIAVDLGYPISTFTSAEHAWMRVHGPDYGWDNPSWARSTGAKPEPWHFEFFAAGPVPDRAWKADDVAAGAGGPTAPAERRGDDAGDRTGTSSGKGSGSGQGSAADKDGKGKAAKAGGGTAKGNASGQGGKAPGATTGGGQDGKGQGGGSSEQPGTTAKVTVPDVAGQTVATAKKKLQSLGLKVTTVTRADDDVRKGTVVTTRGAGTKVRPGSTVTLVVSSGPGATPAPEQVAVPSVAGQDGEAAEQALQDAGLDVTRVEEHSTKQPAGVALRTDPGAGSEVKPGSTVTLVVSSGPEEEPVEQVTIPEVTGMTVAAARAKLEELGFAVETSGDVGDDDLVVKTRDAGEKADKGSTVLITGGAAAPVPEVAGSTVAAAREELEQHGFDVVTEEGVEDDAEVEGTDVAAGEVVLLGTEITLVVRTGEDE